MSAFSFLIDVDGDDSDDDDDYDDDRVSQAQFVVLLQICVAYKKHTMSTQEIDLVSFTLFGFCCPWVRLGR